MSPGTNAARPHPPTSPARWMRPATIVAGCALALLAIGQPAAGQQEPEPPDAVDRDEPVLVEAPRSFRIGVTGSALAWEEATTLSPEDGSLWGLDVERILFPFVAARLSAAYGTSSIDGGSDGAVDLTAYLLEVLLQPRLAISPLEDAGVVPFGTIGIGTVVHDPDRDGLVTRSQNALSVGAGVEYLFHPRVGARAEWRHYAVQLENVFADVDRSGTDRSADRFEATLFFTL